MYITCFSSILHFGWCYLLVFVAEMDIIGASTATIITYFTNFALITIYCKLKPELKDSFFFFTKETFHGLSDYLKIGLPSCFMFCLECWSYEILALVSVYISIYAVGTMAILINTFTIL